MFRSVVVPLDGSGFAEHALLWAVPLARHANTPLQILHVVHPPSGTYSEAAMYVIDELDREARARGQAYLDDIVRRIQEASGVPVKAHLMEGDVAPAVCEHAAEGRADLVVMATHGRGAVGRFWLGSVADEMIRHAPLPLLLIRPPSGEAPDLKEGKGFRHVLVPLDGMELAERILEPAVSLAEPFGAGFTLLRVLKPVLLPPPLPESGTISEQVRILTEKTQQIEEQERQDANSYVEGVADRLRARGLTVQTELADEERPATAILHSAEHTVLPAQEGEQEGAPVDLIALETHGLRGLRRLILGSVADKVIRGAHVPVLVHRPLQT
jgi:nucleotide-binding universal stress UspA family protein